MTQSSATPKRLAASAGLVAGGLVLLAGCAGGQTNGDAAGEPSAQATQMYTWYSSDADKEQWDAYVAAAQAEDPDFELELSGVAIADFYTKAPTRLQQSDAPCLVTTQAERALGLSKVLTPLDDLAEGAGIDVSQYNEGMVDGMTIDGSLRGIPLDGAPSVVYYNKALFADAGLSAPGLDYSRDDFLADATAIKDAGHTGVALNTALSNALVYQFGNGSTPVVDGKLDLTNKDFVEDLQWLFDLSAKHGVAVAPDATITQANNQQDFMAGKVGLYADGPWMYSSFEEALGDDLGVAVAPSDSGTSSGMVRGTAVGISEKCADKEAAAKVLQAFTAPAVLGTIAAERGQVPAVTSELDAWTSTKSEEAAEVVTALLENSLPLQTTDKWDQVNTLYTQYSPQGFSGQQTAKELLQNIQNQAG